MKTNFIAKHKWWALAIVLMVALMAVSVSYSTWDTLSVKASMKNAKSGSFLDYVIKLSEDKDNNKIISVGDIVEYGRFYQDADAVNTGKTDPQRWVVVDYNSSTKVATLLTEKVVVYGNFWGGNEQYYQNYYQSTVRSWLNSGKGSLKGNGTNWKDNERYVDNVRNDGFGSAFSGTASNQVNKGFLDVAFTDYEKSILISKKMQGIKGYGINNSTDLTSEYIIDSRNYVNDLVWLPSYNEIFAQSTYYGRNVNDGSVISDQFKYFKDKVSYANADYPVCSDAISGASEYAINGDSSYFDNGGGSANGSATATWWWLRAPNPLYYGHALHVGVDGSCYSGRTHYSYGGVRPAVCVQL